MTVVENLEMGAFQRNDKSGIKEDMEHVFTLFPRLAGKTQKAGTMSGGEQQMCAIGRAMMAVRSCSCSTSPRGLRRSSWSESSRRSSRSAQEGTPILLVEQNALMALEVAQRAYVMQTGRIVLEEPGERTEDE